MWCGCIEGDTSAAPLGLLPSSRWVRWAGNSLAECWLGGRFGGGGGCGCGCGGGSGSWTSWYMNANRMSMGGLSLGCWCTEATSLGTSFSVAGSPSAERCLTGGSGWGCPRCLSPLLL